MIFDLRWTAVWRRNFRVWQKIVFVSLIGNFVDPLIYLLALGYGLGHFVGKLDGIPYLTFLTSGIVCASAMNAATFEALYSVYTRIASQKTWDGFLATPLDIYDILQGEVAWAATKGLINATAILIVAALLGLWSHWITLLSLPIVLLVGICFASMGLIVTAFAKGYDFFTFYQTLFIVPMMFFSNVFFPIDQMPSIIQYMAKALPLYHAIALVRPLMTGLIPNEILLHLGVLIAYTLVGFWLARFFLQRKVIN